MNSTTLESTDVPDNTQGQSISGFGYGMGLSLGVLLLIIVVTYASYAFTRRHFSAPSQSSSTTTTTTDSNSVSAREQGLDEATLLNYPKLLYAEAKLHNQDSTASGCSICLADYKNTDMLRLLPECGHLFHLRCIDPWLKFNPTCPICRNSPVPTPRVTPMAVVVPLPN